MNIHESKDVNSYGCCFTMCSTQLTCVCVVNKKITRQRIDAKLETYSGVDLWKCWRASRNLMPGSVVEL